MGLIHAEGIRLFEGVALVSRVRVTFVRLGFKILKCTALSFESALREEAVLLVVRGVSPDFGVRLEEGLLDFGLAVRVV